MGGGNTKGGTKQTLRQKKKLKQEKKTDDEKKEVKRVCPVMKKVKIDKIKYKTQCTTVLLDGEDKCPLHKNKEIDPSPELPLFPYTCQTILTGSNPKDPKRSRNGLTCEKKCSTGENVCKIHKKTTRPKTDIPTVLRTFKVRAYPTKEQKATYSTYSGYCRVLYNMLVQDQDTIEEKTETELKKQYVTKTNLPEDKKYLTEVPYDVREAIVKEFVTGRNNAMEMYNKKLKYKKRPRRLKKPKMKYRTKRMEQSIPITKKMVTLNNDSIYTSLFGTVMLRNRVYDKKNKRVRDKKYASVIANGLFHEIKFLKTKTGKYYFAIPYDAPIIPTVKTKSVGACDPGCRVFATICNTQNEITSYCKGASEKIGDVYQQIKKFKHDASRYKNQSEHSENKEQKITAIENSCQAWRKIRILEEKVRNRVRNMHYLVAGEMVQYDTFLYPHLATNKMVTGTQLSYMTKKKLMGLSHSTFERRLKDKASLVGCTIMIISEYNTTRACGRCLFLNHKVGSSETYRCPSCGWVSGRDVNASRNILLKNIVSIT
jgi:transposase